MDGIRFDSKREANRYVELKLMEKEGLIDDLRLQVPLELIPSQKDEKGRTLERPVTYVADFVYLDKVTGERVIEDVKGVRTPEYIIKRKLVLYNLGIKIKEV